MANEGMYRKSDLIDIGAAGHAYDLKEKCGLEMLRRPLVNRVAARGGIRLHWYIWLPLPIVTLRQRQACVDSAIQLGSNSTWKPFLLLLMLTVCSHALESMPGILDLIMCAACFCLSLVSIVDLHRKLRAFRAKRAKRVMDSVSIYTPESEKEVSFSKSTDAQFRGGAKVLKTAYGDHVYWKLLLELLALYARPTDELLELLEKKSKEYKRRTAESCAEIDATVQARGLVHDPEVLLSIDARLVALRTTRDNIEVERLEFGKRVFAAFCAIDVASEAMTAKVLELCKLVEDAHALLQAGCVLTSKHRSAEMRARQAVADLIVSGIDPKVIEAIEQVRAYFKPATAEPATTTDSTRLRVAIDTATADDPAEGEVISAAKPDAAER